MNRVGRFEKVSYERFVTDWQDTFGRSEEDIRAIYDAIALPVRATSGSAGYDYFAPCDIVLEAGQTLKLPTGIRCYIEQGWMLANFPKSGLGFKYRLQLDNTVGIIDSDYYYSDNEGHIFAKITNDSNCARTLRVDAGKAFMQGVFIPYGVTVDDNATGVRNGGFGSTDAQARR